MSSKTWAQVRPRIEAEIAGLKEALVTASLGNVTPLQARCRAMQDLMDWFEDKGPAEEIFPDVKY